MDSTVYSPLFFPMASNNSTAYDHAPLSRQDIVFAAMYSIIVLIGVPANCIIITIVRKTPSMHTTTNYLLMNLAIADLTTLTLCPGVYDFSLNKMSVHKTLGDFICKVFVGNALVPITINVGTLTVSTLAIERYLALVKPFYTGLRLTKTRLPYIVVVLWVFAILSCIPDFMTNTIGTNSLSTYPCKRPWSLDEYSDHSSFIIYTGVFFGIIPCAMVFFCYLEIFRGLFITNTICATPADGPSSQVLEDRLRKKQLFKLLVWLTILFCICTLPFSLFFIYLTAIQPTTVANNRERLYFVHRAVKFLLNANSFCNPVIYALQSSNYRKEFKRIFCCSSCFRKKPINVR